MEDKLFLKLKNGDVHYIDNFVDFNMFMESIDGFLEHHETAAHYTTQFFRLSVDGGNGLAFHATSWFLSILNEIQKPTNRQKSEHRKRGRKRNEKNRPDRFRGLRQIDVSQTAQPCLGHSGLSSGYIVLEAELARCSTGRTNAHSGGVDCAGRLDHRRELRRNDGHSAASGGYNHLSRFAANHMCVPRLETDSPTPP